MAVLHTLLLTHPGNAQVYTALQPWVLMCVSVPALVLVEVSGTEDRGLCGLRAGGFLLSCPWERTGDFSPDIFGSSHRLFENAVSYPSEDEE